MSDELRFEMDKLVAYDAASLIAEMRRVAKLIPAGPITARLYDEHARAKSTTVRHRFGGWLEALTAAGLENRYGGKTITDKMRSQPGRFATAEEVITDLNRVAEVVGRRVITRVDVAMHALISERTVLARFGTWQAALEASGLKLSRMGRRYSEEDFFDNMLAVWTHYGRAPLCREMDEPPSSISSGGYESRFGTWGRAKQAFVDRVNADVGIAERESAEPTGRGPQEAKLRVEDQRHTPVGLRYQVLRRDRFRCVTCGRSPATDIGCVLHVDHVLAFSRGGKTRFDNLRSLCEACNLGKSGGDA